jgi:hypothetical protein
MNHYEVTVWPEGQRKPYTAVYVAPTSTDALNRALGTVREAGVSTAHVRQLPDREIREDEERRKKP